MEVVIIETQIINNEDEINKIDLVGNILNFSRKFSVMLVGIFFSSLGVSLSVKSTLGATPVGVCPAVFSQPLRITTGTAMAIMLGFFFLSQILILRKSFPLLQLLQLTVTVIYSSFVDIISNILALFPDKALWQRVIYCTSGTVVLALGVYIMLKSGFPMLPQDAIVRVISEKYNKEYGKIKVALDSVLSTIALIGSLLINGKMIHIGLGTIFAAIFVGKIISLLKNFEGLNRLIMMTLGEVRKDNQYGYSKSNIFVASQNEYGAE